MEVFSMVVALLSGVAMFLYGMMLMGDALKLVAGRLNRSGATKRLQTC